MHLITPVTIKTPDGVERALRFTLGAQRRIAEEFGGNLLQAFIRLDESAVPAALYCCMYDENGLPPEGLTLRAFQETADPDQIVEMTQALRDAMEQGRATKNVLTAMDAGLRLMKEEREKANQTQTPGSSSGALPTNVSEFPPPNSGTSPSESSTPLPAGTLSVSA
jgi:hypothetical protein